MDYHRSFSDGKDREKKRNGKENGGENEFSPPFLTFREKRNGIENGGENEFSLSFDILIVENLEELSFMNDSDVITSCLQFLNLLHLRRSCSRSHNHNISFA